MVNKMREEGTGAVPGTENIELLKSEEAGKTKPASGKSGTRKKKAKAQEEQPDDRTIEELFAELDGIIGKLEDGEISLEDSFHYYEAGMKLVQSCSGKIDKVEKQIQVLNESAVEE